MRISPWLMLLIFLAAIVIGTGGAVKTSDNCKYSAPNIEKVKESDKLLDREIQQKGNLYLIKEYWVKQYIQIAYVDCYCQCSVNGAWEYNGQIELSRTNKQKFYTKTYTQKTPT